MSYPPHDPTMPVVAVDFDGTLASSTWPSPRLGVIDPAAVELVEHYHAAGCEIVVFTARPVSHHERIWQWLRDNNLDWAIYDVSNVKPVASLYFDDRAVRWPLGAQTEQEDLLQRFLVELRKPTGDGAKKRRHGKPPWYRDETHERAIFSHLLKWKRGEMVDRDSGAHPLAHAGWRCLAIACQETGNVPDSRPPLEAEVDS